MYQSKLSAEGKSDLFVLILFCIHTGEIRNLKKDPAADNGCVSQKSPGFESWLDNTYVVREQISPDQCIFYQRNSIIISRI